MGSKPTRPQARAATPLQLCEMAKIPTESGPGWEKYSHNKPGLEMLLRQGKLAYEQRTRVKEKE